MKMSTNRIKRIIKEAVMNEIDKKETMADIDETKDILDNLKIAIENNPDMTVLQDLRNSIINLRKKSEELLAQLDNDDNTEKIVGFDNNNEWES